jgi:hypothetical protein
MRCYAVSFVKIVLPSSSGSSNGPLDPDGDGSMTLETTASTRPRTQHRIAQGFNRQSVTVVAKEIVVAVRLTRNTNTLCGQKALC